MAGEVVGRVLLIHRRLGPTGRHAMRRAPVPTEVAAKLTCYLGLGTRASPVRLASGLSGVRAGEGAPAHCFRRMTVPLSPTAQTSPGPLPQTARRCAETPLATLFHALPFQ
jgi:hypothetical protein